MKGLFLRKVKREGRWKNEKKRKGKEEGNFSQTKIKFLK